MSPAFSLRKDAKGRLVLDRPDEPEVVDVRIRRSFPWSEPNRFISIRGKEGKEIILVEDLDALPEDLRALINEYLSGTSFIPRIERVIQVDVRFGFQQWKVQTDRGGAEFRVQEREDVRFMPDGRFSIKDANGNLYEMPQLERLDEHSRRAIESLL